jgi:hypothetical protein
MIEIGPEKRVPVLPIRQSRNNQSTPHVDGKIVAVDLASTSQVESTELSRGLFGREEPKRR